MPARARWRTRRWQYIMPGPHPSPSRSELCPDHVMRVPVAYEMMTSGQYSSTCVWMVWIGERVGACVDGVDR